MKKVYALALVIVLLLSFTSFAGAEDKLYGWTSSYDNHGLSKDPITLTMLSGSDTGVLDSIQFQAIENATGVTLELIQADAEKYMVLQAGGDLPDIFYASSANPNHDLIDTGAVLCLDDYEEYLTNALELTDGLMTLYARGEYGGAERKLYLLPTYGLNYTGGTKVASYNGSNGYYLRFDIYQAVGMPEITDSEGNFDEDLFIDALLQMQEYVREVTGKDNVYALSGAAGDSKSWPLRYAYDYGISGYCADTYYSRVDLSSIAYRYGEDSDWWNCWRFYWKANQAGIVDPEIFSLTGEQYRAKVDNSEVLVYTSARSASEQMKADWGETAGFYMIKGMPLYANIYRVDSFGTGFGVTFINANCKEPERACAVVDYIYTSEFQRLNSCGLQGVDWDYDSNGMPVYINDAAEAYANNAMSTYWSQGNGHYKKFDYYGPGFIVCDDGYPDTFTDDAAYTAQNLANDIPAQNFLAAYDATDCAYPGELYAKWVDEGAKTWCDNDGRYLFVGQRTDALTKIHLNLLYAWEDYGATAINMETEEELEEFIAKCIVEFEDMGALEQRDGLNALLDGSLEVARSYGIID